MLLTRPVLDAIVEGRIDLVFRRWRRPTVKPDGRLRTVVGELGIHEVEVIDPAGISDDDARRAGALRADDLRAELFRERSPSRRGARPDDSSQLYRIRVSYLGADPRRALRDSADLSDAELDALLERLRGMDRRASRPWTIHTLELISAWPGRRAPELAEMEGLETVPFKASVRRLKELGLTESLAVGYRLSSRGERTLAHARDGGVAT